jgi:hypothetical protein
MLSDLYENPTRLEIVSNNAQKLFISRFSAKKVYSEMSEYIERIAESHN